MSSIVSEQYQFVIGVDTHAATHTFALVAGATSAVLDHAVIPTSAAGLSRAEGWLAQRVGEAPTLVVIEGTGSFGAILTERLQSAEREVVEAARMPAGDRRGTGKSDELDALRIARAVLGLAAADLRTPRALATDRARVSRRIGVVGCDGNVVDVHADILTGFKACARRRSSRSGTPARALAWSCCMASG